MATTHNERCFICGASFEATRSDAKTCSITCRTRAHRRRTAEALGLLARQTKAITDDADPAVLAELAREAQHLLGNRRV